MPAITPKSVPSGRQSIAAIVACLAAFSLPRGWSIEPETSTMITSARCCRIGTTAPRPAAAAGHGDDGVDLGAIGREVLVLKGLARRRSLMLPPGMSRAGARCRRRRRSRCRAHRGTRRGGPGDRATASGAAGSWVTTSPPSSSAVGVWFQRPSVHTTRRPGRRRSQGRDRAAVRGPSAPSQRVMACARLSASASVAAEPARADLLLGPRVIDRELPRAHRRRPSRRGCRRPTRRSRRRPSHTAATTVHDGASRLAVVMPRDGDDGSRPPGDRVARRDQPGPRHGSAPRATLVASASSTHRPSASAATCAATSGPVDADTPSHTTSTAHSPSARTWTASSLRRCTRPRSVTPAAVPAVELRRGGEQRRGRRPMAAPHGFAERRRRRDRARHTPDS